MTSELGDMRDIQGFDPEFEEPRVKMEPMVVQSPSTEALCGGKKDKCGKKKPAPKGPDKQFTFIIFLILILLLFSVD